MLLQEFFFRESLQESGIPIKNPYNIDHKLAKNVNGGIEYPILFPLKRVNDIEKVLKSSKKNNNYFFQGKLTEKKKWILEFQNRENTIINFSDRGRNPKLKYFFDEDYFSQMCSSKFTLCPTDVYPWSYRFFESIMCKSIPIIDDNEVDIYSNNFMYYRKSENHKYNYDWVEYNLKVFMENHTFRNEIIKKNNQT